MATPHIQAVLVAAVDTGMRQGEMLALRFNDVDLERGLITLRGETTKSRKTRVVPISTERLRAVIEWLRLDADGDEKPEEALVFSNEAGEPLRLFHRTWVSLVLRAHGLTPTWAPRMNYQGLSDASQDAFRRINLRWHDLRHEYACAAGRARRAAGSSCATSSATRRSRPPSATTTRRSPTSRSPPPSSNAGTPSAPAARDKVSRFFRQIAVSDAGSGTPPAVPAIEANELADLNLRDWQATLARIRGC